MDAILQGSPEEYNPFIMMIYNKGDPIDIYIMELLLYVQKAQLDKYKQEIVTPSATANIAQGSFVPNAVRHGYTQGRGKSAYGIGHGKRQKIYIIHQTYLSVVQQLWSLKY